MRNTIFLSIKPWYAESIMTGAKTVELRKTTIVKPEGLPMRMLIYATSPLKVVAGEVGIESVLFEGVKDIWEKYSTVSGMTRKDFFRYYQNHNIGVVMKLKEPVLYSQPISSGLLKQWGYTIPNGGRYASHTEIRRYRGIQNGVQ